MWTVDQGRCAQCTKIKECPDAVLINKTLRKLQDDIDLNEGGSAAGLIVVVCNDQGS